MTNKQNHDAEHESRSFGDIQILSGKNPPGNKPARRRPRTPRPSPGHSPKPVTKRSFPYLLLLCIPMTALALYIAGAHFLVPILIKGPGAEQLSRLLNRPVSADSVSFAPFTFRLQIKGLSIGPNPGRENDDDLCHAAALTGRIRPTSLLRGKVVLEDLHIEQPALNLIRYRDGNYNILPSRTLLPPWLRIQGFRLTDGTAFFHDVSGNKEHHINQIQIVLPAADSGQTVEPSLSAMVNSSPILLRGQRSATADGRTATRLTLQLKDLNPQQYLTYLTNSTGTRVTGGSVDTVLEITLQDISQPGDTVSVTGKVTLSDLTLEDTAKTFQLNVPSAQMVLQARPLQRLYTIENLVIDAPQVSTKNDRDLSMPDILTRIASLLTPDDFVLNVDRLEINNGSLNNENQQGDRALNLLLTGFQNQSAAGSSSTDSSPAQLVLSIDSGDAGFEFQGQVAPSLALTGKIALQNVDTGMLQPYLQTFAPLRFSRGTVELTGTLTAKQTPKMTTAWEITDSTLRLNDFTLVNQNSPLVKGQELSGRNCRLQAGNHRFFCSSLSLDNAVMNGATAPRLFENIQGQPEERLFPFENLSITNSSARIPFPQADEKAAIELSDLNLQLTDMDQKKQRSDNLTLQAAVGRQGIIELSGRMERNGHGLIQLTAADIDILSLPPLYSSWFTLPVLRGKLQIQGSIQLPENQFNGSFRLEDFKAENTAGTAVRWRQGSAVGVSAGLTPFSAGIQEVSIQQPAIRLPPGKPARSSSFVEFFKGENNKPTLPTVRIKQCTINDGGIQQRTSSPDGQKVTRFTRINGTFSPLQPGFLTSFSLSGRMNDADFNVTGRTGLNNNDTYELEVNHFALASFSPLFSESLGIEVQSATADWYFSSSPTNPNWIRLTGLLPEPDSELSLTLALLTDQNGSFTLPAGSEPSPFPEDILEQNVTDQLRKLRLQAAISPRLVLDKYLPELNLPEEIEFLPGETLPDFMEGLEDYAPLLMQRPGLSLGIRGNYDDNTDRQYLLDMLQDTAATEREMENLRREELRTRLLADEEQYLATMARQGVAADRAKLLEIEQRPALQPLPQEEIQLPVGNLQDLGRQRAGIIANYLSYRLKIPSGKIELQEPFPNGTKTEILLQPARKTDSSTRQPDSSTWRQLHLQLFPDSNDNDGKTRRSR